MKKEKRTASCCFYWQEAAVVDAVVDAVVAAVVAADHAGGSPGVIADAMLCVTAKRPLARLGAAVGLLARPAPRRASGRASTAG